MLRKWAQALEKICNTNGFVLTKVLFCYQFVQFKHGYCIGIVSKKFKHHPIPQLLGILK